MKSSSSNVFVAPSEEDLKYIIDMNDSSIPLSKYGLPQIYNTLKIKRLFGISVKIGCFNLKRFSLLSVLTKAHHEEAHDEEAHDEEASSFDYIDFLAEIWNHWEYYAMRSPLWQNRLPKECTLDHIKREIIFPADDEEDIIKERFYELYGYELDEQCKEVMDLSHKDLPFSVSLKDWLGYQNDDNDDNNTSMTTNLYYLIEKLEYLIYFNL